MQDFSGKNLRGYNFTGQDLRGADFSGADIRGANFSGAKLSGADFTGAKAGLQRRFWLVQLVISFALSTTLNFIPAVIRANFITFLLTSDGVRQYTIVPGIFAILLFAIVFFSIAFQGLTSKALVNITIASIFTVIIATIITGEGDVTVSIIIVGIISVSSFVIGIVAINTITAVSSIIPAIALIVIFGAIAITKNRATFNSVVGAIVVSLLCGLLSTYIAWRASKGDEKFALVRTFRVVFMSIGGTRFYEADLTRANFTNATLKSTNFREATLTHVCWKEAKKLDRARVGDSILQNSAVRDLLVTRNGYKKFYIAANLEGANFQGINLEEANLTRANLSNTLLHDATLIRANLRESLAIGADFTRAYLTGACLEAWNIDHTTKLNEVDCQYVFLLDQPNSLGSQERRPHNPDTVFGPGDFEKLYQKILNTVQILMRNGINQEAFAAAFQQLMQENPGITRDSIQGIEKKGNDVLLTIEVPEDTDKAEIARSFETTYSDRIQKLEAENKQHLLDFKTVAMTIAKNPLQITNVLTTGNPAMNDNSINITGSTINLGEISGSVSNVVNQLSSTPEQQQLKEYLIELQAAIGTESALSTENKADALEEVKTLAEAVQDPAKQGLGGKAIRGLKRMIDTLPMLPNLPKLVANCCR